MKLTDIRTAFLVLAAVPLLSACLGLGGGDDCAGPQLYQSAREVGPLRAPEGLSLPAQRSDRRIPEIRAAADGEPGRCLDQPPQVLSNESVLALAAPKPGKRAAAPRATQPWPEAPDTAWISIDPLEGADLAAPLRQGLPAWQVHDTLQGWAKAWSRQEAEPYFAFYAGNFVPEGGLSWSDWKKQRTQQVTGQTGLDVSIYGEQAQALGPDRVFVRFTERLRSDAGANVSKKEMLLIREGDVWSILREREGG